MVRSKQVWLLPGVYALTMLLALAYELAPIARNAFRETFVWSLVLVAAMLGWGSLVSLISFRGRPVDLGLRAVFGVGALTFLGGVFAAVSLMGRSMALALVVAGALGSVAFAFHARTELLRRAVWLARCTQRQRLLAAMWVVLAGILFVWVATAIADWHTNPYDDQIAYLAFVRKLLDTGTLLEPFSFRRLSALGGQSLMLELALVRADADQAHVFDRGICLILLVALVVGHPLKRGVWPSALRLVACFTFLTLPLLTINTASYYSGVVVFLGIYRTIAFASDAANDRPATEPSTVRALLAHVPLALLAMTACTLRQNYLAPVFGMLATRSLLELLRGPGTFQKRVLEVVRLGALFLLAIAPWLVLAWRSNKTILYPIMGGTFDPALGLNATGWSMWDSLRLQLWSATEGGALRALPLIFIGASLVSEQRRERPLLVILVGAAFGFVALVQGFSQADAVNIARYAFSFLAAFMLAGALAVTENARFSRDRRGAGAALVLAGFLLQASAWRENTTKEFQRGLYNVDLAWAGVARHGRSVTAESILHAELQASIPAGKTVAVLLDEPHYLDYARNPIWNIDMPGYASPGRGLPFFKGSEAMAEYFRSIGVTHLAFVRESHSRYHYRRDYWVSMMFTEEEIWRNFAPYVIDMVDALTDMAKRYPVRFESKGLVVVDLTGGHP